MKTVIIVLATIAYIGWAIYKRVNRAFGMADGGSTGQRQDYDEPDSEEEQEFVYEEPDVQSNPYFSYEYESPAPNPRPAGKPSVAAMVQREEVAEGLPQFDLRQAVIYQTVLNNRYISEINQINQ